MSDDKKYTLRDMVLAQREAYVRGYHTYRVDDATTEGREGAWETDKRDGLSARIAARKFPLPKLTRPRVVTSDTGRRFRIVDGQLQTQTSSNGQSWCCLANGSRVPAAEDTGIKITLERIRLWADLLANPTEDVEASE